MQTEENQMQEAFKKAQEDAAAAANQEQATTEDVNNQTEDVKACDDTTENVADNAQDTQDNVVAVKELMAQNVQLQNSLQEQEAKYKEQVEKLIRTVAETENQKKRIEADVERERKFGNEKLLKALIPVVDSLELALKHSDPSIESVKPIVEGVENTVTLFLKELKTFGVEQVDPKGDVFDPNLHQAISMVPAPGVEANHIVDVMQKGYTLNGRVVRAAMVIVSSGAPAQSADTNSNKENSINIEA